MESYLIQSNAALVIFYLLFKTIFIKDSNQLVKRFVGLGIVLFCSCFLLIPSIEIESSNELPGVVQEAFQRASSIQSTIEISTTPQEWNLWLIIYLVGVLIFSARFLMGIGGIIKIYRNANVSKKWGFILVATNVPISPFSFFNCLFIHKNEVEKPGLSPIILHEKYHKDQLHSVDAILLEIVSILFWFNPVIWLLVKDVKDSHEFMADDYVIVNKGFDKLAYQNLLFEARTGVSFKSANYLSKKTSLKQRFNMMEKRKTHTKTSYLRAGIILTAMTLAVFITSFSTIYLDQSSGPNIKIYTNSGEVDIEKGISKNTDRLFIRAIPKDGDELKYRVADVEATLVAGGQSLWSINTRDMIEFGDKLSNLSEESMLMIEVKKIHSLNTLNQVNIVNPEDDMIIRIPVR